MTRRGKAFPRKKLRLPWWFNIRSEERAFRAYAPALWEEIGDAERTGAALVLLNRIHWWTGRVDEAWVACRRAVEVLETVPPGRRSTASNRIWSRSTSWSRSAGRGSWSSTR